MKDLIILVTICMLVACSRQTNKVQRLQAQIDSLRSKLDNGYKPGFGEFMSSIQIHHAKLWFAGANNNWKLAEFEVKEIEESLEDIQKFCIDRPEVKSIAMINPAIDSLNNSIRLQNQGSFKTSFVLLTNTCNNCHKTTEHEFNIITTPSNPPISNQSFKPGQ